MKKEFHKKRGEKKFDDKKKKFHAGPKENQKNQSHARYKNYLPSEKDILNGEKITGIYSQARDNDFGFVDVEGQPKGYFVYPKNLNGALDGDQVEAVLKVFNKRKEAVIINIIKRADRVLVGTIDLVKDFAFVILDNPAFKNDVHISNKKLLKWKGKVKNGEKVAIKITTWSAKNPEGSIIEVLGEKDKKGVDIMGIALEGGARITFPEAVLEEAEKLKFEQPQNRIDLTQTLTFTIDGEDAKDLDDAIYLEKKNGNYTLIVSIADVAEYVKEGSKLDIEALKRGNSTYLVDRVIPMLPEKLSNDLCSLNPHTKKLTLSCEMQIDQKGKVISKKVYESMISSKFRLTYREVQEMLDGKLKVGEDLMFGGTISQELLEAIGVAYELKTIITKKKTEIGILDFDFPETKILLDHEGNPIDIKKYERYESMKIIEEFMILANESVSELYSKVPFVYRVHPVPNDEDIDKLRHTLAIFGFTLPYKNITPKTIAKILKDIEGNPKEKLLSKLILRSLEKAIYSEKNEGHFGLNLEYYSHFTSPIRRYPDTQIHRIIKEKIHSKLTPARIEHFKMILPGVSKKTSETERKSEKLEYAVRDLMVCKYYQTRIGEEFQGVISGTIPAGFFVELENTAEGFVAIEQALGVTGHKKFNFEQENMKFDITKDFCLQVGDLVRIKIASVEIEKRRLNFDFIEKIVQ